MSDDCDCPGCRYDVGCYRVREDPLKAFKFRAVPGTEAKVGETTVRVGDGGEGFLEWMNRVTKERIDMEDMRAKLKAELADVDARAVTVFQMAEIGIQTYEQRQRVMNMSFSHALARLRSGERIARQGWNGKGMYLFLGQVTAWRNAEGMDTEKSSALNRAVRSLELKQEDMRPCIFMVDAQGKLVPGWLASQTDMLADDWEVVQ